LGDAASAVRGSLTSEDGSLAACGGIEYVEWWTCPNGLLDRSLVWAWWMR
jgi:hypothetical protein